MTVTSAPSEKEDAGTFALTPGKVQRAMFFAILMFAAVHAAIVLIAESTMVSHTLVQLANLDDEKSLATLFVVGQWMLASYLLYQLMKCRSCAGTKFQWASLLSIFEFMTVDEFCSLHEQLSRVVHSSLDTGGVFVYAWIVPYAVIATTMVTMLWGLWRRLPPQIRRAFFISAVLFGLGAIGVEMFEGMYAHKHGTDIVYSLAFVMPEETLEMAGLAVFIPALIRLLGQEGRPDSAR